MIRMIIIIALIPAVGWGRSLTPDPQDLVPVNTAPWSKKQALWHRVWAGPVPGFSADMAILSIFNIYAQAQAKPIRGRSPWWSSLKYQLQLGQNMDPYFRDIYRLTEGLLAYEAQDMHGAIAILSMSEPYLNSSDPLLVAAFIAHQELKDNKLAAALARRAAEKPDSDTLALGFATNLIRGQSGCKTALTFLQSRLNTVSAEYQQGIIRRIRKLQEEEGCQKRI
jgi:hypothetical protein